MRYLHDGRDEWISTCCSHPRHLDGLLHLQIAPVILERGERLWDGLTARVVPIGARATRFATHMDYRVAKAEA